MRVTVEPDVGLVSSLDEKVPTAVVEVMLCVAPWCCEDSSRMFAVVIRETTLRGERVGGRNLRAPAIALRGVREGGQPCFGDANGFCPNL